MEKIKIKETWYHAREIYGEDDEPTGELELILDENGQPIPATVCLCHAYGPLECSCGAWDDVDLDWWYSDDDYEE